MHTNQPRGAMLTGDPFWCSSILIDSRLLGRFTARGEAIVFYFAQQDSLAGSLKREIARIFRASAIVG